MTAVLFVTVAMSAVGLVGTLANQWFERRQARRKKVLRACCEVDACPECGASTPCDCFL